VGEGGTEVPHDGEPLAPREPRRRDQRGVVEVHELESPAAERVPELDRVPREAGELAGEQEPAPATVRRRPDVREPGHGACVDDRAGLAEEVGGRPRRAVDMGLELLPVELANEVGKGLRGAAELAAVMDEQDWSPFPTSFA